MKYASEIKDKVFESDKILNQVSSAIANDSLEWDLPNYERPGH